MTTDIPTPSETVPTPLKVARAISDALRKRDLDAAFEFTASDAV